MFQPLAGRYEWTNRVLTFGLDLGWRRHAVARVLDGRVRSVLDVGTGTGEVALALACRGGDGLQVTAVDFSEAMLAVARAKPGADRVRWVLAPATNLPFDDAQFDAAIVAFALRNLSVTREHLWVCLREIRRVLRPGGRLFTVETSQPPCKAVRGILHLYARWWVPVVGGLLTGQSGPYRYLGTSIRAFYDAETLARAMLDAGFSSARFDHLTWGLVALHVATR